MGHSNEKEKPKRKTLERDIQREICDWLHSQSFFFWRSLSTPSLGRMGSNGEMRFRALPKYTPRGLPDIWVIKDGAAIGIEVKRPGAKMRPEQADFGVNLMKNGGEYHVVHSLEEAKDIFRSFSVKVYGEKTPLM